VKAGLQFLFDYRIGLGEQVAFTVETRKLPVNTRSVCFIRLRRAGNRAAHSVLRPGLAIRAP